MTTPGPRPHEPDSNRVVSRPNTTFKPRRRGLSPTRQAQFERWLDRWGLDDHGDALDWSTVFPADMPVALDIGFGHGEATIGMASASPGVAIVGVEVHTPGVVNVLDAIEHTPLPNVRVVHGDVLRFLTRVPSASLAAVRIYFPDPWPKARHHDRRLVRRDVVEVLVDRLVDGGELHLATDVEHYAREMRTACDADANLEGGIVARPESRPLTRFEQRGLDEGRPATDLSYRRLPRNPM